MNARTMLSVATVTTVMAFSGFAIAQEEHIIDGKPVPADQIEVVEARCQELHAQAAETPASDRESTWPAPVFGNNHPEATTEVWSGDIFSIDNLTIDHCNEGNFAMQTAR